MSFERPLFRLHAGVIRYVASPLVCTQREPQGCRLSLVSYKKRVCGLSSTLITDDATLYDTSFERPLFRLHAGAIRYVASALVCTQREPQGCRLSLVSYKKRVCGLSSTLITDDATSYDTSFERPLFRLHAGVIRYVASQLVCTQRHFKQKQDRCGNVLVMQTHV